MTGRRKFARVVLGVGAVALVAAGLAGSATAAAKAPGTATPPKGSGINTPAALNDPRCTTTNSPYGRWSFVSVGTGPVCVRPFKDGEENGGATARGVTGKTITIVAVTQNPAQTATQKQQGGTPPKNNVTGATGTMEDALHDIFAAYGHDLPNVDGEDSGLVSTAMRAINAIPAVVGAPAGILDPMEVPPRPSRKVRLGHAMVRR